MNMDVPPSIEESKCALANLHRHIFEACKREQDLDPEPLKKMVIDMAKKLIQFSGRIPNKQ
eukprot:1880395-Karenia_brevis.AAC.1